MVISTGNNSQLFALLLATRFNKQQFYFSLSRVYSHPTLPEPTYRWHSTYPFPNPHALGCPLILSPTYKLLAVRVSLPEPVSSWMSAYPFPNLQALGCPHIPYQTYMLLAVRRVRESLPEPTCSWLSAYPFPNLHALGCPHILSRTNMLLPVCVSTPEPTCS